MENNIRISGDISDMFNKSFGLKRKIVEERMMRKIRVPVLIESLGNEYRVVSQDSSYPRPLFYGTLKECTVWKAKHCIII